MKKLKFLGFKRREVRGGNSNAPADFQNSGQHANASSSQSQLPSSTVLSNPSPAKGRDTAHFPDGIIVWRDCPDATVDICFVHGLSGNRESTWTAHGQSVPWPVSLLPPHLPRARLLTYGYDAYVIRVSGASQNRLLDHATNLVTDLTNDRLMHVSSRPLIFVAHSLGGLVCKEAILYSRNNAEPHLRGIFDCVTGIIFMGTPHRGSWIADWAKIPASALGLVKSTNTSLLAVLKTESQLLVSNQTRFWSMVRELREAGRRLEVTCFFEELPLNAVGPVVSKESAILEGYHSISIHANHSDMVKIGSPDENGFKRLRGELVRWEQSIIPVPTNQHIGAAPPPAMAAADNVTDHTPPSRYYVPFLENKLFVGRGHTLDTLDDAFFVRGCNEVAIVGLGGVGKTQVALRFAYHVQKDKPHSVFWAPAYSHGAFKQACVEIARELQIQQLSDNEDPRESVQRYLSSTAAGPWLLVVDNADDIELLFGSSDNLGGISNYFPKSEHGLILFTTRFREVAVDLARTNVVELRGMGKQEAATLFEASLIQKHSIRDAEIEELLDELTYLPLAIVQAAAYLNKKQMPIAEYLRLLRNTEKDMINLLSKAFRDGTRYAESENAVATTWLLSFEQIRQSDAIAIDLLAFLSCIEPKAIPRSILPPPELDSEMSDAIGTLCGYAFLVEREGNLFDMHRLVHMATRVWLEKQTQEVNIITKVLQHITSIFPSDDNANRGLWRQYLPHALSALQRAESFQTEERCTLSFLVGLCLHADSRTKEAIAIFEHVVAMRRQTLAEDDSTRLWSEHALASAYLDNRQIKEAITILEHIVKIRRQMLAEDDNSRLVSEHELARAYLDDRRIKEAITIFKHIVAIERHILAEDDNSRLASEHELARAYLDDRRIKEAITIFEHVVKIQRQMLAEDDNSRLWSEHELARAYLDDRRIKEAITILEHVVKIRRQMLAEDDTSRLVSEHELAKAYIDDNQVKEAIVILEHVVAIERHILAEDDYFRVISEQCLAWALEIEKQVEETAG